MKRELKKELVYIYGKHAVIEALKKRPEIIVRLYVKEGGIVASELVKYRNTIPHIEALTENNVPRQIGKDSVHQGFVALVDADKLLIPFKTWKDTLVPTIDTSLILLGEVQDPHNVGAIIRSAAAFGVTGVLVPEHRSCPITGTVIKTSAGMVFNVPLIDVANVNYALRDLKERGFWVYGLDGSGDASLHDESFDRPSVFVVGNESRGIRLKTHELCDTILTIPMHKRCESLNASVSAATVLSAWSAQHPSALR